MNLEKVITIYMSKICRSLAGSYGTVTKKQRLIHLHSIFV